MDNQETTSLNLEISEIIELEGPEEVGLACAVVTNTNCEGDSSA